MSPTTIVAGLLSVALLLGFGAGWRLRGAEDTQIHNINTTISGNR